MVVNAAPTIYEVQEMLDCIAQSRRLDDFFPVPKGCSRAEHLSKGWVYLFYDDDFTPLGYCVFSFSNKLGTYPWFGFIATAHCKPIHILYVRRLMLKLMDSAFSQGVRVYIINKRVESIALKSGFKRSPRNKHIFFRKQKKD